MNIPAIASAGAAAQGAAKNQTRQDVPVAFVLPETQGDKPPTYSAAEIKAMRSINDAIQTFTDYMKQTPAERMQAAWLAQHGVSKEDFDAMSPDDKKKLMDQMKQEIREKIRKQTEDMASKAAADIFA